jgi:signal transduction histidine kinase
MARNNPQEIKEVLSKFRQEKVIQAVAIYSSTGAVWFSTQNPGKVRENLAGLSKVLTSGQPALLEGASPGLKTLRLISPVVNKPSCQGCHTQEKKVLGALEVQLDTHILAASLRKVVRTMAYLGGFSFLVLLAAVAFLVKRNVLARLFMLTDAVRRIAGGDYQARVEGNSRDELGELSKAINYMSQLIGEYTADLNRKISELTRRLSSLGALSKTLSSTSNLRELFSGLVEMTRELLRADGCTVYLLDKGQGRLGQKASAGHGRAPRLVLEKVVKEKKPQMSSVPAGTKRGSVTIGSFMVVPVLSKEELLGVMEASCVSQRAFSPGDLSLFSTIAHQVAVALENLRLFEAVQARKELRGMLLERILSAQEEERRRIARELHDEAGQGLNALLLHLESLERELPPGLEEVGGKLASLREFTARTLQELHRVIYELRPTLLDDLGLGPAIRWYTKTYLSETGIHVALEIVGLDKRLPSHVETALFRITQEGLTNAVKHARAKNVSLKLEHEGSWVKMTLQDDGKGFDVARALESAGRLKTLGLSGIEERVDLLGGKFSIVSAPGRTWR